MNGFLTVIPLLLIRFGLLGALDKRSMTRAAYFAPVIGTEKIAYLFYQLSNIMIFIYLFFLRIKIDTQWFSMGLIVYGLGILLCIISIMNFAKPSENGFNRKGLYRFSRNPMYVAYFVYFLGCVVLTQSLILLVIVIVFQISSHWIIRSEERWCIEKFGEEYLDYMKHVRRYI